MKIGVYGGSFNPCHLVHKQIVLNLLENYGFDRIVLLPTGNFYKKSNLAKGEMRIHMLNLMFQNHPKVILCDYEFKNNLICTYRSLDYLQNLYKGDKLYFIMGSDNLLHFDTWKRYEYILDTYNLFVIVRKDIELKGVLEKYQNHKGKIELVDIEVEGFNSSFIRECVSENKYDEVAHILDSNVLKYIQERRIYTKEYQEYREVKYTSDEEFLKNYNSDDYEKMSITTDITLFSVSDIEAKSYRKKNGKSFSILLVERESAPFMSRYCIPGGFLSLDEKLLDSAKRILFTEANIDDVYLNQFHTFSDIDRDVRGRVLSVSFLGLIDKSKIVNDLKPKASFFDITINQNKDILTIVFKNESKEFSCKVRRTIDAYGIISFQEEENEYLAFDHLKIIVTALEYLKNQIQKEDIVYHLLPKEFTLKELQMVYEAILGKKLIDSVFRRTIKDKVISTEKFKNDGGHRPSRLYSYKA
ncbi:MAG: nicotinate (nicotinamide) nucleotide adenylyltransferase [Roseburia sp.]|nr:nicotinate (nicotinamide) nucleotide adenylyltransferase [Anaeroplasma bactoclasticum]MCM1196729.1 nicotinate (nicotinamide) nucleotide adenylyltransferase [Roseburia sp.]MCM1557009.1 nicotinate (nicotinamide) nucleotide adenylyltransferase [Anaeroplasma bactoclasticum]